MELMTKRLHIRLLSDEEMRVLKVSEPNPEMQKAYGEMLQGCEQNPSQRHWYAVWQMSIADGTPVGDLCFKGLSDQGEAEIGYGTYPGYEGRGYMTEAVIALTKWAAGQSGVKEVQAETELDNLASQRVLAKAGYLPCGKMGEEGPRFTWCGVVKG